MKALLVYPHGLGDCILATPALRAYKKAGNFIGFAMLQRFFSAKLFANCPYIDQFYYTPDAWNDYSSFEEGCEAVKALCHIIAKREGFEEVIFVGHSPNGSKIRDCATALGVELEDIYTEIFITDDDREEAKRFIPKGKFGFVQTKTGVPIKDFPEGYGREWLFRNKKLNKVVEVGKEFTYDQISINVQFAIMEKASAVCLPDSVFYHACCAMDKKVDLAYFGKGEGIYRRVRPLHPVNENVVYKL